MPAALRVAGAVFCGGALVDASRVSPRGVRVASLVRVVPRSVVACSLPRAVARLSVGRSVSRSVVRLASRRSLPSFTSLAPLASVSQRSLRSRRRFASSLGCRSFALCCARLVAASRPRSLVGSYSPCTHVICWIPRRAASRRSLASFTSLVSLASSPSFDFVWVPIASVSQASSLRVFPGSSILRFLLVRTSSLRRSLVRCVASSLTYRLFAPGRVVVFACWLPGPGLIPYARFCITPEDAPLGACLVDWWFNVRSEVRPRVAGS